MDIEGAEEVVLPRLWENQFGVNFLRDYISYVFMETHGLRAKETYLKYKSLLSKSQMSDKLRLLDSEEQFKCVCGVCLCGDCPHTTSSDELQYDLLYDFGTNVSKASGGQNTTRPDADKWNR